MQSGWQIGDTDETVLAKCAGAFDGVFQLAHVTRPVMGAQSFHGLPAYLERLSRASMDLVSEKMADQEWNIVTTFAEGWEVNGNNIEPIVEVFPESAVLDSFFERFVARRDNADVYVNRDVVAHSADFAFLENAQESALEHRGHGPDFIQKNRAAVGLLKKAFLVIDGPGEGSFAMAEQLGFQKILR